MPDRIGAEDGRHRHDDIGDVADYESQGDLHQCQPLAALPEPATGQTPGCIPGFERPAKSASEQQTNSRGRQALGEAPMTLEMASRATAMGRISTRQSGTLLSLVRCRPRKSKAT